MTKSPIALLLLLPLLAGQSARQGHEFTKGAMRFKVGDKAYDLPLLQLAGASSLTQFGKTAMLNLVYKGAIESGNFAPNARMALRNLTGPGTFDNKAIMNLVVEINLGKAWSPNDQTDHCKLTITALQPTGAAGTLSCTGQGAKFGEISFNAAP